MTYESHTGGTGDSATGGSASPQSTVRPIGSEENVARFLTQSSDFKRRVQDILIMPSAFAVRNGEVSVELKDGRHEKDLIASGIQVACKRGPNRTCYGWAELQVEWVRNAAAPGKPAGLDVRHAPAVNSTVSTSSSNPFHANIVGWPEKDIDAVLDLQQELASRAIARIV